MGMRCAGTTGGSGMTEYGKMRNRKTCSGEMCLLLLANRGMLLKKMSRSCHNRTRYVR